MTDEKAKSNPTGPASGSSTPTQPNGATSQPPTAAEIIPPEITSAFRTAGVDPSNPGISRAIQFSLMLFGGPIPPPSLLAEYNKAMPGLGDKIVGWTEQQRDHRQSMERERLRGSQNRQNRGQLIAALVAFWGLTLSAVVGIWGSPWVGGILAVVSVGGPVAAIVLANTFRPKANVPAVSKNPEQKPPAS
jgi:uncharacterized membrane protein